MSRKIIPLIVVILPLILVTVASALEVGNLKLVGAGKEKQNNNRTPGRTSHPPDGSEGALWNNIITCIYLPSHFFGHRY
ncbi:hypothetical protein J7K97_06950 [Candidatus Aerophobetes bacterium]|nr:hypothetical protein [Candidatus Aerophobetes bacterium]